MNHYNLIIPVEVQVREFDAKLLLGCLAAEQNYSVFIGTQYDLKRELLGKFKDSVYIAKALTKRYCKTLKSLEKKITPLIAGWDEEAIVYYSPDLYRKRRVDSESLAYFNMIFAWGNDNKKNLEPVNHHHVPIEVTGNPRADLLRPEFNTFFLPEIDNILHQHGDFILFNSNFGSVNPFNKMYKQLPLPGEEKYLAQDAPKNYDPELAIYRHRLLDHFVKLIPILAQQFPQFKIVIRPHPAEGYDLWLNIAQHHSNVVVIREGNVLPWLKACKALIHNGCTTAVEASLLGVQPIAYRPISHPTFDPELPNNLSYHAHSPEELVGAISAIANNPKAILSAEQSNRIAFHHQRLFNDFIATSPEILASEKIIQSINNYIQHHGFPKISFTSLLVRKLKFFKHRRKMLKRHQGLTSRVNIQARQNEFPTLSLAQVQDKVLRLSSCLNHRFDRLIIRQLHDNIFSISNSVNNGRIKNK